MVRLTHCPGAGRLRFASLANPSHPPETLVLHGPSVIVSVGMVSALCAAVEWSTPGGAVAMPAFDLAGAASSLDRAASGLCAGGRVGALRLDGSLDGASLTHPSFKGMACRFIAPRRPLVPIWIDELDVDALGVGDLEVVRAENLRTAPNGERIGRLEAGTRLRAVSTRGDWREVEVEGWIWTRSLQIVDRNGYDLVVSVEGGENLRASPGGDVRGSFVEGALLRERERVPGWIRVTRQAWIWGASVRTLVSDPDRDPDSGAGTAAASGDGGDGGEPGAGIAPGDGSEPGPGRELDSTVEAATLSTATPVVPPAVGEQGIVRVPTELRATPASTADARLEPGAEATLLEVEGAWARVRLEGWVPLESLAGRSGPGEPAPALPVTPGRVAADPGRWQGQLVVWTLEFVSLEEADERRPDFAPGAPWLLMRWAGPEAPSFVYVAVSEAQAAELGGLAPLSRVTVRGRIRRGAARWTGRPVLELESWRLEPAR